MLTVIDYIENRPTPERSIWWHLHELLTEQAGLEPKVRHGLPFYYGLSWIAYLQPIPPAAVELVFLKGTELSNMQGLPLRIGNRKMVRGIAVTSVTAPQPDILLEIIQEAILLDELAKDYRT